jgi:hypothetical protein
MVRKFRSNELFVANVTHYWTFWTVSLEVIIKLSSGQVLVFFYVTNVTTELRTVELSVGLEFTKSFPYYFTSAIVQVASVREFTKIDAILKYFIYFL